MQRDSILKTRKRSGGKLAAQYRRFIDYGDRPWNGMIAGMAIVSILLILLIGGLLWQESSQARQAFGWSFLLSVRETSWNPVMDKYNAWPFVYGTLLTSLVALILAVPVSMGVGIFLAELSPSWLRLPLSWMVELLSAIPSVIYGLWGIFVFLPEVVAPIGKLLANTLGKTAGFEILFSGPIPASGASRLAAALVLTIMITPTIAAISRDVFLAIPASQREASLALGATQWETIWQVLIPYGLSGFLGAIILGLGRALGETMAVTMVIGNSIESSLSILRPGYTMSSIIANEFAEAVSQLHSQALVEIGLILFFITLLLNILARFLVWQVARKFPMEVRA